MLKREKQWTLRELVEQLSPRRSYSTWRRMIRDNKVQAKRIGSGRGMLYISDSEVQRLLKTEQI